MNFWFCRISLFLYFLRCCSSIQIFGRSFDSRCSAPDSTLDSKLSTSSLDSQRCQIRWPNHPKLSFYLVQPRLRKYRLPLGFDLKACDYAAATGAPERDMTRIFRFQPIRTQIAGQRFVYLRLLAHLASQISGFSRRSCRF